MYELFNQTQQSQFCLFYYYPLRIFRFWHRLCDLGICIGINRVHWFNFRNLYLRQDKFNSSQKIQKPVNEQAFLFI